MACHNNSYNGMKNGNMRAADGGQTPNMQTPPMAQPRMQPPMRQPRMQPPMTQPRMQPPMMQPPTSNAVTSASPLPPAGGTPSTVQNPYYTAGFLRQYIGRDMRVEYLIGTNGPLVDRVGRLVDVGADYILLQPYLSDDLLMTDLFSIKFVTIFD